MYDLFLESDDKKTAVFAFGRMNPPTVGHAKLADAIKTQAKSANAAPFLFITHTQKPKTDPLSHADKVYFANKAFGNEINVGHNDVRTIIDAMIFLSSNGFTDIIYVAGSDRVDSFNTLLNKYNGQFSPEGKGYEFNSITVVSAGERDPDSEGVDGMSASKMRAAATEGDYTAFEAGTTLDPKSAKEMYDKVRLGMGIKEPAMAESEHINLPHPPTYDRDKRQVHGGPNGVIFRGIDDINKLFRQVQKFGSGTKIKPRFLTKLHTEINKLKQALENNTALEEEMTAFDRDDPMNSTLTPPEGMGSMSLRGWTKSALQTLNTVTDNLNNMDNYRTWKNAEIHLGVKSPFQAKLREIIAGFEELQNIRSKGGKNSRNIAKESMNTDIIKNVMAGVFTKPGRMVVVWQDPKNEHVFKIENRNDDTVNVVRTTFEQIKDILVGKEWKHVKQGSRKVHESFSPGYLVKTLIHTASGTLLNILERTTGEGYAVQLDHSDDTKIVPGTLKDIIHNFTKNGVWKEKQIQESTMKKINTFKKGTRTQNIWESKDKTIIVDPNTKQIRESVIGAKETAALLERNGWIEESVDVYNMFINPAKAGIRATIKAFGDKHGVEFVDSKGATHVAGITGTVEKLKRALTNKGWEEIDSSENDGPFKIDDPARDKHDRIDRNVSKGAMGSLANAELEPMEAMNESMLPNFKDFKEAVMMVMDEFALGRRGIVCDITPIQIKKAFRLCSQGQLESAVDLVTDSCVNKDGSDVDEENIPEYNQLMDELGSMFTTKETQTEDITRQRNLHHVEYRDPDSRFLVIFHRDARAYIARGTGEYEGQIAPTPFGSLDEAIEHAEIEIEGCESFESVDNAPEGNDVKATEKRLHKKYEFQKKKLKY